MKKLFILSALLFTLVSCGTDNEPYSYLHDPNVKHETVVLRYSTTAGQTVFKQIFQAREMYVNWGDNSKPSEFVFINNTDSINTIRPISHTYISAGEYDININALQIRGVKLTGTDNHLITQLSLENMVALEKLHCDNQPITKIEMDKCPLLRELVLTNNTEMDAQALNDIFRILPQAEVDEDEEDPVIVLSGNKGDSECDRSIASAKGWIFKSSL